MGVRFIYGVSGSGKSTFCINDIKERLNNGDNNKLIYIVPEQYTFQREKMMLDTIGEKSLLRCQVISFKRMAHRVFEECGGRTKDKISDSGRNMLIYKVLEQSKDELVYFNRIYKEKGFSDIISKSITEFKKYNITSSLFDDIKDNIDNNELVNKLQDLFLIFNKFNSGLDKSLIDGDDELTILSKLLEDCTLYDDAEIYLDEFTTFTPQQLNIVRLLAKRCRRVNISLCMDTLTEGKVNQVTDIFDVTKNTEKRILDIIKQENITYLEPINLNKNKDNRFVNSKELSYLEKSLFTFNNHGYSDENEDIRIYKANNAYDEMEYVAKEILSLVRDKNYRYKDISVVCRNIEEYEKVIAIVLNEYNIPFFLDKKIDILSNPLVVLILSSIEISIKNWSYESVFKYLKSGLTGISIKEIDALENYVLANGIKGYKWTGELKEEDEDDNIKIMKRVLEPLITFHNKITGNKTIREICTAIYEFLLKLDVFNTINNWINYFEENKIQDKVKEYEQIPSIVNEILDQAVSIIGDERVELYQFLKILNGGFEGKQIGVIPVALDQVNIGDISRIKGRNVKALFVLSVNDGVLPSISKEEGIISDRDREILKEMGMELASTNKIKVFEEQFMVYTALTLSSKLLFITYKMADFDGKSLRPSIMIPRIKRVFPKLIEESSINNIGIKDDKFSKVTAKVPTFNEMILALRRNMDNEETEEYWNEVYVWYENNYKLSNKTAHILAGLKYNNESEAVPREKVRKLYSNDSDKLIFSVSRLEQYANCPFSYYVKYGLKAKDRKIYEFSAPDIGSFMHEILDEFTNKIRREKISWSELNTERCRNIISELISTKLKDDTSSILNSSKKYNYFTDRFKRIITKSVSIISEQMRKGQFEIFSNEFVFGNYSDGDPIKLSIPSGDDVYLTGRIDRIDTLDLNDNTYIRIIDYKSGAKKFDLNELYYGLQIQLLVYLDAILRNSETILKKQAMPGAILYFKIDDPIIKSKTVLEDEEIKKEVLDKLKMNGLLLKDAELVRAMDNDMVTYSLVIPASFKKDGDFSKTSAVITEEQFDLLREYVNKKMIDLCEEMLSGVIKIAPIKNEKKVSCEYCDYSSICQFDSSIKENNYNIMFKRSDEEIWNGMRERINEVNINGGN